MLIISMSRGVSVIKKQVVKPYYDGIMSQIYDTTKLIDKTETTKAGKVVIGANESYNGNDYMAVMIIDHILQIFDILDKIEIEFIDILLPLFVALTVIIRMIIYVSGAPHCIII